MEKEEQEDIAAIQVREVGLNSGYESGREVDGYYRDIRR